ncbi:MAG TPA: hypothetical protein VHC19_08035 [Pirellulales bacterium]|nr:hypothetical protein [Pirellulales bacterium]
MSYLRFCLPLLCWACLGAQAASAHFLWLRTEPAERPAKVRVFFGEAAEPDDPELLDRVQSAEVWLLGGRRSEPKPLTLKKGEAALEAELPAGASPAAVILRCNYGVISRAGEPFLLQYYGKTYPSVLPGSWQAVGDKERLPLEIVPTLEGDTMLFEARWQGKPLAGATLTIAGPGLEEKWEAETDEKGACRCRLPGDGVYSIRLRQVENTAGEQDDQAYQSIRRYSTLTLPYARPRLTPEKAQLPDLPQGTTSFGGAVAGDVLYVYGGNYGSAHEYSMEGQSGDLHMLNLARPSDDWKDLPGGPKLQGLALVEHQGLLYRVGGFSAQNHEGEDSDLRSQRYFARYSPASKTWEDLPELPEARSSHDAAVGGNILYVAGGWNMQGSGQEAKWHDTAWSIDLSAKPLAWKQLPAPPFKRRALSLATWQGKLYCIGGMLEEGGPTTAVDVYDIAKKTWSEGPALLGGAMDGFGSSAFACHGSLYVTTISGSIQRLADDGSRWEFAGQLANPRFFHRMLPWADEKLVLVGGGNMSTGKIVELEMLNVKQRPMDQLTKGAGPVSP